MQNQPKIAFSPKHFLFPRKNLWFRRTALLFSFILFDYFSTISFCKAPFEEANLYARAFMEMFGIPLGLTVFVLVANFPIYVALSLDSHIVRLPFKFGRVAELTVDCLFAWFVAGAHFSGGSSWFWNASDSLRQFSGMLLYLVLAFVLVKPHKPSYDD